MLAPHTVTDVFSPAECAEILALAEARAFAEAGLVGGARCGEIRRARIAWLDETPPADRIFARIVETVIDANRAHFGFDLAEFRERLQVARYEAAEAGHFDWHADIGDGPIAKSRKLTLVVQLSAPEAYEGGALELMAETRPWTAPRAQGTAVLFPAFVLHRVRPVTRGTRHSLTTWVHGPDFR